MHTVVLFVACLGLIVAAESEKKIICYADPHSALSLYFVDPTLCTHLVYSFVEFENDDIKNEYVGWGPNGFSFFNEYRQQNPDVNTMIAVGGWGPAPSKYFEMASNSTSREQFANNAATFVKKHQLNGLILHWLFPRSSRPGPNDQQNYVELVKALREHFDIEGLILGAAVNAPEPLTGWYNISEISKYLDFINLVSFEAYDEIETRSTAVNAPLYASVRDPRSRQQQSIEATVFHWLNEGAARDKLIVGLPMFGSTYTLDNPTEHGVGAYIRGVGAPGPVSRVPGTLQYREICKLYWNGDWSFAFDEERRAPYAFRDLQWIGYNNVKSFEEKAEFIERLKLGGAMAWEIHSDDWQGTCGVKYPLLKTLNAVLRDGSPVPGEVQPQPASENVTCTKAGYIRDPQSCGLIRCARNSTGGYVMHRFECSPGNCHHPLIGKISAESVDVNFFVRVP